MISSIDPPGWLNGAQSTPRGTLSLAVIGSTVDALLLTSFTSSPSLDPERVEVERVDMGGRAGGEVDE